MATRIKIKNTDGRFHLEKEKVVKEILSGLLNEKNSLLTEKETQVLRLLLIEDKKVAEAGNELNLFPKRIQQIFDMAVGRINSRLSNLHERLNNEALMQNEIKELKTKLSQYEERKKQLNALPPETQKILSVNLEDIPFTKRVLNAFHDVGIHTVEDLVKKNKSDFLRLRNIGKKCANEIEEFLSSKGLTWNMKL